ncbi:MULTISPECIES: hypothetical protein [Streptomyces]|uniref:Uncharacterized protein n=1 Tax=Streptomyces eurythermus TaxID=42237 RepID=A0ABW6Z986_9ACTN|nr:MULTISPECIES: hypothetical protein [Streptomyces]QIS68694.1 hypothetical protein HB370_00395 [Streptomyces sp. DSM 40868]
MDAAAGAAIPVEHMWLGAEVSLSHVVVFFVGLSLDHAMSASLRIGHYVEDENKALRFTGCTPLQP